MKSRRISYRKAIATMVLLMAGISVFAGGRAEESSRPNDQVVVRWTMWAGTDAEVAFWEGLAENVTREHPHIRVELETTSFSAFRTQLVTQLASGTQPDIIPLGGIDASDFFNLGGFQSLAPFIENDATIDIDDFADAMIDAFTFNGEIYGLPYDSGPLVTFYNADLFAEHGIDPPDENTTWDEFLEMAITLTDGGKFGYVTPSVLFAMRSFIASAGGSYWNEDLQRYDLTNPGIQTGLQFVADMFNVHGVAQPLDPGNPGFPQQQFAAGNAAMFISGPWFMNMWRSLADFEWGIAPVPIGPEGRQTPVAGSGFAMSARTPNPEATYLAIKSITSTASLTELAEAGRGMPARSSAMPGFSRVQGDALGFDFIEYSIGYGFAPPGPPDFAEFESILNSELERLVFGQTNDVRAVLREITRRVQAADIDIVPFP